jgi:N-hydroxyarylamine O-acetyltransferase
MIQPPLSDSLNLEAYFQRIGYGGDRAPTFKTLQAIHRAHTQSIAFENFNSFFRHPVALDLESLQQKLIYEKRGGYCFEQNLLFRSVLLVLGFSVKNLAARVVWNLPETAITPRTHMLLHVEIDGQPYIADVGFGGLTLTDPLALIPDLEQATSHEPSRLLKTDDIYTLQTCLNQTWRSLYRFDLQVQQLPDYELSNWYVSTHPQSLFVNNLLIARPAQDCRYALLNNQLTTYHQDSQVRRKTLTTSAELQAVLEEEFCLHIPALAKLDEALQQFSNR